jgi:uncharacterized protein DUF3187
MTQKTRRALVAALALSCPPAARATDPTPARRGPLEVRDEWMLAQSRLTLPAMGTDTLATGRTRVSVDLAWGNDFGWQPPPPSVTDFLVDGEHRTLALDVRRGLTPALTVGLRVPVHWRGGGMMDGIIDWFHEVTGLPGGARPLRPRNRLAVTGRDARRRPVSWEGGAGTGLGKAEVLGHWAFRPPARHAWSAALVGRAALPTGTGAFAGGGVDAGAQVVSARTLGRSFDVYMGGGGTAYTRRRVAGIEYAPVRGEGFVALEWRPARRWSVLAEVDASTRLVRNLVRYPGWQGYLRLGAALDVGERWRLTGGFVEGIKSQHATTDFGVVAGLSMTN